MESSQDKFGKMLVEAFMRSAVICYYSLLDRPSSLRRTTEDENFHIPEADIEKVKKIILECVKSGVSSLCYDLSNPPQYIDSIDIHIDNMPIIEGDLQALLHNGNEGWLEKFGNIDRITRGNYLDGQN